MNIYLTRYETKNRHNPLKDYTDFIYYLVNILLNFLKYNVLYKSISYKLMIQIWFIFV